MDFVLFDMAQLDYLKEYAAKHPYENGVTIEYYDAYGEYPCLRVSIDRYHFEMSFQPQEDSTKNEIRTRIYFDYTDKTGQSRTKRFMIKRESVPAYLSVFARTRSDFHFLPVCLSAWADQMIDAVAAIRKNKKEFLHLCKISCPFNDDGTHKFKCWKNYAKVSIKRLENIQLIQGIKGGTTPPGAHVVGGNGSFRVFNKGDYCIEYIVERLAGEKPRRGEPAYVNMDVYLRGLMARLGRQRMPYDLLNSRLPERLEVITYEMDKEPEERHFIPVDYDGNWLKLLQECFKGL